jgi:hypothetical protein
VYEPLVRFGIKFFKYFSKSLKQQGISAPYIRKCTTKTYFKEKKMKRVLICHVLICALLLAIAGCSDDNVSHHGQDYGNTVKPDIEPEHPPDNIEPGDTEPEDPELEVPEPKDPEPEVPEPEDPEPEVPELEDPEPEVLEPEVLEPEDPEPEVPEPEVPEPEVPEPEVPEPEDPEPEDPEPEVPEPEDPEPEDPEPVPFDRTPKMLINELRTEYESSKKRAEYVEFKVKSAGNLEGVKLFIMWDAKKPFEYGFPAIEVEAGEYITLHLRALEDNCVDELGQDLQQSGGTDSCPSARDLWVSGTKKLLHKTDIAYLQNASGGIMDAVIMNEKPEETWPQVRQHFTELTEFLFSKGAWKSEDGQLPSPLDSVDTSAIKSSTIKSVSRNEEGEDTNTANDWYVTASNGITPGLPN